MELTKNIFVSGENFYVWGNNKVEYYRKSKLVGSKVLKCRMKEINGELYYVEGGELKKFGDVSKIFNNDNMNDSSSKEDSSVDDNTTTDNTNITTATDNNTNSITTATDYNFVDFHVSGDNFYVVRRVDDKLTVFKGDIQILSFNDTKFWFYNDVIYFSEDRCLFKYDLLNNTKDLIKKNVIPNILEVYEDLLVMVSHSSIVYIISKDINFTFHKHSTPILGVCRVDNYLYFISEDKRLSVAEINRENRKFLINFVGDFKGMIVRDKLYIITDVEFIEFDTIKSKIFNYTFNLSLSNNGHTNKSILDSKEDEYFELVSMAYKEKKVKREVEPFYKVLNENKYKVEETVYTSQDVIKIKDILHGTCLRNLFLVYDATTREVLRVFSLKGKYLYFHGGYLISLGDDTVEVYKYKEDKLVYVSHKDIQFPGVPEEMKFSRDVVYYKVDGRYFKTSIVLKRIEITPTEYNKE